MDSLTEWNERMIAAEQIETERIADLDLAAHDSETITCEACGRSVERYGDDCEEIAIGMTDIYFCQPGYGCAAPPMYTDGSYCPWPKAQDVGRFKPRAMFPPRA